ncbi:MAG: class I SAM-dependent methyltransferase [Kiloniellales bacterium]|nr:class I SAM-dependent methyltransferase [Kiloniellales bacterium]
MRASERVRAGYNRIAQDYARHRDQTTSLPFLERLSERLPARSRVLDLGCGAGRPVDAFLVERGHQVIGIDISEAMIALARRNIPQASFHRRDMAGLQPGDYQVDAVVSFYALIHVDRRLHRRILTTARSFLPPDGLILVTMGRSDWEGVEDFLGVDMGFSHFDAATNRALIEDCGFSLLFEDRHPDNLPGATGSHPVFLARKTA